MSTKQDPSGRRQFLKQSAGAVAGAYAWFSGGSISAQRAFWGFLVIAILAGLRRGLRPLDLLASIAVVVWVLEPAALFDLGAQFSFAACLGLVAGGVWRDGYPFGRHENQLIRRPGAVHHGAVGVDSGHVVQSQVEGVINKQPEPLPAGMRCRRMPGE